MDGDIRRPVRDEICRLREWKNLTVIQGNVQKDHIHMVFEIPPDMSVSNVGVNEEQAVKSVRWQQKKDYLEDSQEELSRQGMMI